MNKFILESKFQPSGDQPQAIDELCKAYEKGVNSQILLGVTGSGKTFVMANVIERLQMPTLIISPNKILAAQTYAEFKSFFPHNAVEYFISYYDYYQPEAYIPASDTYIEKDSSINDHIDRLRLKATTSLLERKDVIVVASVSCIYNIGSPQEYQNKCIEISVGQRKTRNQFIQNLVSDQYERNDVEFIRGRFRVKGDTVDIFPAYLETAIRVEFFDNNIESIKEFDALTGKIISKKEKCYIYPAKLFVSSEQSIAHAISTINTELGERLGVLESQGKLLEAQRLKQRTNYDMEMLRESGFCHGIENYSCHLSGNPLGTRPSSLLDYFNRENKDFLMIADESHISIPQIGGMYEGDRSRKQTLVDFGFRLPSALDNRPLKFPEFEGLVKKMMMVSATPGKYDLKKAGDNVVELIIRPTGLIDPEVILRPIDGQIDDLMQEIKKTVAKSQRILVTTLTKKTAEDLTSFLKEKGFRVEYLHSEIDTLTRIEILKNLRLGEFDVLVGINLLREGLDLPEVALVAVLDADKEGFLRSEPTLIQICGRAARNVDGKVIFYADTMTGSMQRALNEMNRRRQKQIAYNVENNIKPRSIVKAVAELDEFQNLSRKQGVREVACDIEEYKVTPANIDAKIADLQKQMRQAGETLDFETAIVLRDKIKELQSLKSAVPISKVRKNKKVF